MTDNPGMETLQRRQWCTECSKKMARSLINAHKALVAQGMTPMQATDIVAR